jgi:hypothetical protein
MKFRHPEHGEQIILDLAHGLVGPAIGSNSEMYSDQMPKMTRTFARGRRRRRRHLSSDARSTYPYGAEQWEYLGLASAQELAAHGWQWFQVGCPHCGFVHRMLAAQAPSGQRRCRACGMVFDRPTHLSLALSLLPFSSCAGVERGGPRWRRGTGLND